jgi:hypothetical protein
MKHYCYKLTVSNKLITSVTSENGVSHFTSPVTKHNNKVYLVGINQTIHYIGTAKQPIGARMRYGVKPNHKTGYHGYKWLNKNGTHNLMIWIIAEKINAEAVEAEIAYLFRNKTKQWPKYQTEIHFHQTDERERLLARGILNDSIELMRNFS